jgi:hypothetical protein
MFSPSQFAGRLVRLMGPLIEIAVVSLGPSLTAGLHRHHPMSGFGDLNEVSSGRLSRY